MAFLVKLRSLVVLCAGLALAEPAVADIKAYNAAVMRGDFVTASNEAQSVWASYDKTRTDTAVIAREFAWTSMRAGHSERAHAFARWLVDEGARLPTPDDDPALSRILLLWADLGEDPKPEAGKTLSDALSAWSDATRSSSPIALRAAAELYAREWRAGYWEGASRDAALTAKFAARLGPEAILLEERAKIDAAAAEFLDTKEIDPWFELADSHDELMARMGPPKPGENVAALDTLDVRAHAWMEAMAAYFSFGQRSINSDLNWRSQYRRLEARKKTLKDRCDEADCSSLGEGASARRCEASWDQSPPIRYPASALFKGMVGATILELTADEAGAVTDVKVLAAVPSDTFPDATLKSVKKWKLKRDAKLIEPCTLAGKRRLTVIFRFP